MKYTELINATHKDKRLREKRITKDTTRLIIGVFAEKMFESLVVDGKLSIKNLFTLNVKKNKGKRILDLNTKKHRKTKDYYRVIVVPSERMKDNLKERAKNEE